MRGRPAHGTNAGYQHHRLLRQDPCIPCLEAHNADATARRWAPRAGLSLTEWHALGYDQQQDLIHQLRTRPPRARDQRTGKFTSPRLAYATP